MERLCNTCNQFKKTPYKNICRNCYQKQWAKTIPEKQCNICNQKFKVSGNTCWNCLDTSRKEKSRKMTCSNCKRTGLLILNMTEKLCTKCDREKKESLDPLKKEIRRKQVRESSRRKRGTKIDAPVRKSKGWWLTSQGYVMIFEPNHPNSNINGCINQHVFVMSQHLKRPLKKGESVHHINGQRDDNRIENLELWHRSHPPGQRLDEKIEWAKKFLEEYGFDVKLKD